MWEPRIRTRDVRAALGESSGGPEVHGPVDSDPPSGGRARSASSSGSCWLTLPAGFGQLMPARGMSGPDPHPFGEVPGVGTSPGPPLQGGPLPFEPRVGPPAYATGAIRVSSHTHDA